MFADEIITIAGYLDIESLLWFSRTSKYVEAALQKRLPQLSKKFCPRLPTAMSFHHLLYLYSLDNLTIYSPLDRRYFAVLAKRTRDIDDEMLYKIVCNMPYNEAKEEFIEYIKTGTVEKSSIQQMVPHPAYLSEHSFGYSSLYQFDYRISNRVFANLLAKYRFSDTFLDGLDSAMLFLALSRKLVFLDSAYDIYDEEDPLPSKLEILLQYLKPRAPNTLKIVLISLAGTIAVRDAVHSYFVLEKFVPKKSMIGEFLPLFCATAASGEGSYGIATYAGLVTNFNGEIPEIEDPFRF